MQTFASFDGQPIAYQVMGEGRPVLMLHGFMASGDLNFVQPGIAAALLAVGRQLILPDLRGHGASAMPEDRSAYPTDALAKDQEALLAHLGISDYDLCAYSLGARTAVRMMARGARPARCVLGGMGDSGVMNVAVRRAYFTDGIVNGEKAASPFAGRYMQATIAERGLKKEALLGVLVQQVDTTRDELARIDVPTLVIAGIDDADNGSAEALAALMPHASAARVPGNHLSAVIAPELASAIATFLSAGA